MKVLEKESRVPRGRTDRLTDMKLVVAFRNFANAH